MQCCTLMVFAAWMAAFSSNAVAEASEQEIAYLSVAKGYWQVWVMRADGSQARQITHSSVDKTRASWMADGNLLVSQNDGVLAKVDLASGKETLLQMEQAPTMDGAASPDGKHIAFSYSAVNDGNDLWMVDNDGKHAERLVRMEHLQHEPVWSRDSQVLYYLSGSGGQSHDIWKYTLATHANEQLTVGTLYHFDIAVDGQGRLAYSNNVSGDYEIYLQEPGTKPVQLTHHKGLDAHPAFSPDGSEVIYESTEKGLPNLWKMKLSDQTPQQLTFSKEGARAPAWRVSASGGQ